MVAFYKTLRKTITMTQLALCLLIPTGILTRPLRYIYKNQIEKIYGLSLDRKVERKA